MVSWTAVAVAAETVATDASAVPVMADVARTSGGSPTESIGHPLGPVEPGNTAAGDQAALRWVPSTFHFILRQLCEEHDREVTLLQARLEACMCDASTGHGLKHQTMDGDFPLRSSDPGHNAGSDESILYVFGKKAAERQVSVPKPNMNMQAAPPPPTESPVQLPFSNNNEESDDEEDMSTFTATKSEDTAAEEPRSKPRSSGMNRSGTGFLFLQGREQPHPLGIKKFGQQGEDDDDEEEEEEEEDEGSDGSDEFSNGSDSSLSNTAKHKEEAKPKRVTLGGTDIQEISKTVAGRTYIAGNSIQPAQQSPEEEQRRATVASPAPKRSSLLEVHSPFARLGLSNNRAKPKIVGLKGSDGSPTRSILKSSFCNSDDDDDIGTQSREPSGRPRVSWSNSIEEDDIEALEDATRKASVFSARQRWIDAEEANADQVIQSAIPVPSRSPSETARSRNNMSGRVSRLVSTVSNPRQLFHSTNRSYTGLGRTKSNIGLRGKTWKEVRQLLASSLIGTPNSSFNFFWDMLMLLLICYDIVMIPMDVFDLKENSILEAMAMVTGIYWSLDVFRTFFTGYYKDGDIEMRMRYIALNYLTTWFFLDVAIVTIDWVRVVIKYSAGGDNEQLQNRLRKLRGARALRLLRGVKLRQIFIKIEDRLHSESMSVIFTMIKLFSFLVIINHLCACIWYFIGKVLQGEMHSWLDEYLRDDELFHRGDRFTYRYLTSYHWALTQFTPASISVQPHNVFERAFGVIVLLFALVSVSSFVSGITGAVMFLRSVAHAKSKQFWLLRRYLRENDVPVPLALRIQRYCDFAYKSQEQRLTEKSVVVLGMLSSSLRLELNTAMFEDRIYWHPFCILIGKIAPQVVVTICNTCVGWLMVVRGNTVFRSGEQATTMYITIKGELVYALEDTAVGREPDQVVKGMWACEHPIWCEWTTVGSMVAATNCDIVSILCDKFNDAVHANLSTRREASTYARNFVQGLNRVKSQSLTDLYESNSIEGLWLRLYTEYGVKRNTSGNRRAMMALDDHAQESTFLSMETKLSNLCCSVKFRESC